MDETATTEGDGITWVDRQYPIPDRVPAPGSITGAQTLARKHLNAIAAWGYTVTEPRYIEETAQSAEGLLIWAKGPRGIRTECLANGRPVVIRYDGEIRDADCYTVTVDGTRQPVSSLYGRMADERVRILAWAVHRALSA